MMKKQNQYQQTAEDWRRELKEGGYEFHIKSKADCAKIAKMPRVWKRLFSLLDIKDIKNNQGKQALEVGCGGGQHLVLLAVNGWRCVGVDVSPDVLRRAKNYIDEIFNFCKKKLNIELVCQDFFDFVSNDKFDLVFHFGVLEHFLDDEERLAALKKMFSLTRLGGYVVSVVPNGAQPLRQKMKKSNLGGYKIPEIDYTPELIKEEMQACGVKKIIILPHNIMGYRVINNRKGVLRIIDLFLYYLFQIIPSSLFSKNFLYRHAMTLIGIAQKE